MNKSFRSEFSAKTRMNFSQDTSSTLKTCTFIKCVSYEGYWSLVQVEITCFHYAWVPMRLIELEIFLSVERCGRVTAKAGKSSTDLFALAGTLMRDSSFQERFLASYSSMGGGVSRCGIHHPVNQDRKFGVPSFPHFMRSSLFLSIALSPGNTSFGNPNGYRYKSLLHSQ